MNITHWRKQKGAGKPLAALLAGLLAFPPAPALWAAQTTTVDGVEVGQDQVKITLSGEAKYNAFVTANPPRVVLQLMDTDYQAGARSFTGKGKYLKDVRSGQFQRTPGMISRVVLDLLEMTGYTVSKNDNVITVALGPEGAAAQAAAAPAPAAAAPAAEAAAKPERPKVAAPKPVGETEGMTTKASSDLDAIAKSNDAGKGDDLTVKDAVAASAPPPAARAAKAPRGDILSRLPRDPVSLDFDNTDVKDVMRLLSAKAKVNIIYGADVVGTLTLHLVEVPFNEAFRTTLSMLGLQTMQVGDNILRVLTPAALTKSQSVAAASTKVIPLNYSKATDLLPVITQARTAEGRTGMTIADSKTNSLIVTESLEGLASTERLVAQLDVRPKQVLIEVKLVEVNLNNSLHYGIQWDYTSAETGKFLGKQGTTYNGTTVGPPAGVTTLPNPLDGTSNTVPPTLSGVGVGAGGRGTGVSLPASTVFGALTLGRITNNYFLSATLTAAAAQGKVKVLSDPKVATLNNQPANINVTTSIPYTTSNVASTGVTTQAVQYVVTGIQLSVTPTINADGRITLVINPNVSQPSASVTASITGAPGIDARTANTTVLVKDGETVVIGGLISDSVSNQIAKIPILGDIPILGWLFKKKDVVRTRSELLIFVTPKIMTD